MVALVAEGFNPDCLENHTKLVRHVGDVPRLVGTVGTKEGEVEFFCHRLLRHSDLIFKIGLELKDEVYLLLSAEVGLFFIKTPLQVYESFNFLGCHHQYLAMVAVQLKEPQEVVVVDLEAVPLSANAEDVSDELLGLLSELGEQH